MQVIRRANFVAMPWRNGTGVSYEIASQGVAGGAFAWRLSIACIERSGPFSLYAGYQRVTVLLAGEGFDLQSREGALLRFSRAGDHHAYAGSVPYFCELRADAARALNLISLPETGAALSVLEIDAAGRAFVDAAATLYLLPLDLPVALAGSAVEALAPWDACELAPGERGRFASAVATEAGRIAVLRVPAA